MGGRVESNRGSSRKSHLSHVDFAGRGRKPHLSDRAARVGGALPGISVVLPAYNEERRLKASFSRIWDYLTRRFPSFELIVVDDGSTDGTAKVVEEFATDHHSVELSEGSKVRLVRDSARMFSTLVRGRKRHHAGRSLDNEFSRV